ncbi:hypothetical protein O181_050924 [Austropuccinia psidii MF-1]|uniref:Uncharacterized protein n=1 Tax=Austropuccinia psidii MF-1 TaxID=1389203 RepID=A0A9Q3HQ66_9BASI|nr:hypothetical protein [Austropuccinia psidii MF-1]
MTTPLVRDLEFPKNKPEHFPRINKGRRQPISGLTNRELLSKILFQIKFSPEFQPGDWKMAEQVIQTHRLLKDLFTWSMDNKSITMAESWEEVGIETLKICLKQMAWMDLMEEVKGLNPNTNFKLLEERETGIHTSHIELLEHGSAQSDSCTQRQGRRFLIFHT